MYHFKSDLFCLDIVVCYILIFNSIDQQLIDSANKKVMYMYEHTTLPNQAIFIIIDRYFL